MNFYFGFTRQSTHDPSIHIQHLLSKKQYTIQYESLKFLLYTSIEQIESMCEYTCIRITDIWVK
jgi:hypothetical protein